MARAERKAKRAKKTELKKKHDLQFKRWMKLREKKVKMVQEREARLGTQTVPDQNAPDVIEESK